jgi:23S rRNA pseudouridine2605 synthase/23S rRNA pseudouridine2604 synthase
MMRLQKFLASAGVCSRRKGEEFISGGLVSVNGEIVTQPGTKVDPAVDSIRFRGEKVTINEKNIYIALNKPAGYISSCSHKNEKIVLDLIDIPDRVFPIGRLDKDSEGLILMTTDGELHNRLSHPSFNHEKEYFVRVRAEISNADLEKMSGGIRLEEAITRPCRIKRMSGNSFKIVLQEGRNRQIRRMVNAVGNEVVFLKRLKFAGILLNNLKSGAWRYLSPEEVTQLKKT